MRLDDVFDRLPRSHLRLGDSVTHTYVVPGLAGIAAGTVAMITVALVVKLCVRPWDNGSITTAGASSRAA